MLAIGILYVVGYDKVTDAIPEEYNLDVAPTATIVIGAIIFVIAFLGCCGAIKENRCLLITVSNFMKHTPTSFLHPIIHSHSQ